MADIIIIAVLAGLVFLIVRGQFKKLRRGECTGGCAGCRGCSGGGCHGGPSEKKGKKQV